MLRGSHTVQAAVQVDQLLRQSKISCRRLWHPKGLDVGQHSPMGLSTKRYNNTPTIGCSRKNRALLSYDEKPPVGKLSPGQKAERILAEFAQV
jgi:hypothetical protein